MLLVVWIANSMGKPTLILLRTVESSDTMAQRPASSREVWGVIMRSSMGLPYLFGEKFVEEIIIPSRDVFEYLTL